MPSEIRLVPIIPTKTENKGGNLKFRHFRSGGNPVCLFPVVFRSVTFEPSFSPLFPQKQKTKNRNLKSVIPAQAGI
ncbi:TPA: hypothetical protein ACMHIG_001985 [Neisseria lactamica]